MLTAKEFLHTLVIQLISIKGSTNTTIIKVQNLPEEENGKLFIESFLYQKKNAMSYEYKLKNNYILKKEIIKKYGYSNNFTI